MRGGGLRPPLISGSNKISSAASGPDRKSLAFDECAGMTLVMSSEGWGKWRKGIMMGLEVSMLGGESIHVGIYECEDGGFRSKAELPFW